jgi:hypothetical protein
LLVEVMGDDHSDFAHKINNDYDKLSPEKSSMDVGPFFGDRAQNIACVKSIWKTSAKNNVVLPGKIIAAFVTVMYSSMVKDTGTDFFSALDLIQFTKGTTIKGSLPAKKRGLKWGEHGPEQVIYNFLWEIWFGQTLNASLYVVGDTQGLTKATTGDRYKNIGIEILALRKKTMCYMESSSPFMEEWPLLAEACLFLVRALDLLYVKTKERTEQLGFDVDFPDMKTIRDRLEVKQGLEEEEKQATPEETVEVAKEVARKEKEEAIAVVNAELAEAKQQVKLAHETIATKDDEIKNSLEEVQRHKQATVEVARMAADLKKERDKKDKEIQDLAKLYEEATKELETEKNKFGDSDNRVKALNAQKKELEAPLAQLKAEIEELNRVIDGLKRQVKDLQDEIILLKAKCAEKDEEIARLKAYAEKHDDNVKQLEDALEKAKNSHDKAEEAEKEKEKALAIVERLTADLEKGNAHAAQLENANKDLKIKEEKHAKEVADNGKQIDELVAELENVRVAPKLVPPATTSDSPFVKPKPMLSTRPSWSTRTPDRVRPTTTMSVFGFGVRGGEIGLRRPLSSRRGDYDPVSGLSTKDKKLLIEQRDRAYRADDVESAAKEEDPVFPDNSGERSDWDKFGPIDAHIPAARILVQKYEGVGHSTHKH